MHAYKRLGGAALVALAIALALPAMAGAQPVPAKNKPGVNAAVAGFSALAIDTNNDISTAVPATSPTGTITGTVSALNDEDDVFSITIPEGKKLVATLTGAAGTDFDLYLHPPGNASVKLESGYQPVRPSADSFTYPENLAFAASRGGTYYMDVWAALGGGPYTLTYSIVDADTDDLIPGVAGSAEATGTFDAADSSDVYSFDLTAGDTFKARLLGPIKSDFDLYLYYPGASVTDGSEDATYGVAYAIKSTYPDDLSFEVTQTGTYYLQTAAENGVGAYTLLTSAGTVKPTASLAVPTNPSYNASTTVTGKLWGETTATPLVGKTVDLYAEMYGYSFVKVGSYVTDSEGAWKATGLRHTRATRYFAYWAGDGDYSAGVSVNRTVLPKAYLTKPSASKYHGVNAKFSAYGLLAPRRTTGSRDVQVRAYRYENGKYVLRKTFSAVNSRSGDYTKYTATVALPYRGTWRLYAFTDTSPYYYKTVSSSYTLVVIR